MLELFVCALIISYEIDTVGFIVWIFSVGNSLIIEQSKVRVWIVVIGSLGAAIRNPNVHSTESMFFSTCVAEISTWVNTKFHTDSFVRGNIIQIAVLFKVRIVW